jgi:glyoxylase-like metal-dependent hydrolase (beta-lactamase superfamily II)
MRGNGWLSRGARGAATMGSLGRAVVAGLAVAWAGCASVPAGEVGGVPALAELRAEAVAEGVYVLRGTGGEPEPANRGRLGNAGFIVGPHGVIVVDAGVSYRHGRAILAAIAAVTDRPVRLLLITHVRQEFLFGAAAFRERGIPVAMHREAALLMAARCENCLKTLRRVLGEEEMRGTTVFKPDEVFDGPVAYGQAGRAVTVQVFGHSAGPGDIAVLDERTGTVFAGGLADAGRIPDVQDSRLPEWHRALDALEAMPIRTMVPGHGAPGPAVPMIAATRRYLQQLHDKADRFVRQGMALSEVADALTLPDYAPWDQYDNIHRRNAAIVFLRLERELLVKPD